MFVLEDLQGFAPQHSERVVGILQAMLETVGFAPGLRWLNDHLLNILRTCQKYGDEKTRLAITIIANRMIAHHHLEFEELLKKADSDDDS